MKVNKKNVNRLQPRYLEDAQDMIFACTPEGIIVYANKAAGRRLGIPARKLIGHSILEGIEEYSRSLAADLLQRSIAEEGWHGEFLLQRVNGVVFPAYVSASPIKDSKNQTEQILIIAHDISERKRLEEEVRKKAEIATSIIRIAPIGIFTLDLKRKFSTVNRAFADMLGFPSLNNLMEQDFEIIAKEIDPDLVKAIEDGFSGKETTVHNRLIFREGRDDLTVSLVVVPLKDIFGNVESVLGLVENRTELMKAEEQLLQADKLASTGFLAAGIAHEINNPLTGIYTIIDTLANRVKREGGNEEPYLRVLSNIDRIKDIIRRLLDYADPTKVLPSKADPNALMMQILDFFKFHPIFRKVEVKLNLDKNLPEIIVDPKQIQWIFNNLAMNAAQAMKDTGGRLEISSKYIKPGIKETHGWIEIRMRDTGPGINEENLRRIFDPFFTTKPPGEGTGLGLSVSYSIAKNHGGDLTARNHPDGGAEFILRLPAGSNK